MARKARATAPKAAPKAAPKKTGTTRMTAATKKDLKVAEKKNKRVYARVTDAEKSRLEKWMKAKKLVHYRLNQYGPAPKARGKKPTWTATIDKKTAKYVFAKIGEGASATTGKKVDAKTAKLKTARAAAKAASVALAGERAKQKGAIEKVGITFKAKLEKLTSVAKAKLAKAKDAKAKKAIRAEYKKAKVALLKDKAKMLAAPKKAIFEKRVAAWKARCVVAKLMGKELPVKPSMTRAAKKTAAAAPAAAAAPKPPKRNKPGAVKPATTPAAARKPRTPR